MCGLTQPGLAQPFGHHGQDVIYGTSPWAKTGQSLAN